MLKKKKASGNGNVTEDITGRSGNGFPPTVYHVLDRKSIELAPSVGVADNGRLQRELAMSVQERQWWRKVGSLTEDGIFKTVIPGKINLDYCEPCFAWPKSLLELLWQHKCRVIQVTASDEVNGTMRYTCTFVDFLRRSYYMVAEMLNGSPPIKGLPLQFWQQEKEQEEDTLRFSSTAELVELCWQLEREE